MTDQKKHGYDLTAVDDTPEVQPQQISFGKYAGAVSVFVVAILIWDMWGKWSEPDVMWPVVKSVGTSLGYWFFFGMLDYFFFRIVTSKPKKRGEREVV